MLINGIIPQCLGWGDFDLGARMEALNFDQAMVVNDLVQVLLLCTTPDPDLKKLVDISWQALRDARNAILMSSFPPFQMFCLLPVNSFLNAGRTSDLFYTFFICFLGAPCWMWIASERYKWILSGVSGLHFDRHAPPFCSRAGLRNTGPSSLVGAKVVKADAWLFKMWKNCHHTCCYLSLIRKRNSYRDNWECLWFLEAWVQYRDNTALFHWGPQKVKRVGSSQHVVPMLTFVHVSLVDSAILCKFQFFLHLINVLL